MCFSQNTLPLGRIATGHVTIIMYKGHIWVHCDEGHRVNHSQCFYWDKISPIGNPKEKRHCKSYKGNGKMAQSRHIPREKNAISQI